RRADSRLHQTGPAARGTASHLLLLQKNPRRPELLAADRGLHQRAHRQRIQPLHLSGLLPARGAPRAGKAEAAAAMNERVQRLEEKVAYLERHVTEKDKAMLELTEPLARLRQELRKLRERLTDTATGEGGEEPAGGRPPHY